MAEAKEKKKKTTKASLYKIENEALKRNKKHCPKCGPGVFMAEHENRTSCGNCGFTEWKSK
jgi:small subunit ribosomal protein S27Ae